MLQLRTMLRVLRFIILQNGGKHFKETNEKLFLPFVWRVTAVMLFFVRKMRGIEKSLLEQMVVWIMCVDGLVVLRDTKFQTMYVHDLTDIQSNPDNVPI